MNIQYKLIYTEAKYIADFSDNKKVAGTSDNIFVGKIIKNNSLNKIGKEKFYRTEFVVEVLYNIKGSVEGKIITTQSFGYDKKGNTIKRIGGKGLMQKGEIYLLATAGSGPYTIMSHPNGSHLLTGNVNLDKSSIKKLIKENKKIKDFRKAYKEEILYEGDYKISSGKNVYRKLSKEDKEKFENIENGFLY